jgi:hypothetical protein
MNRKLALDAALRGLVCGLLALVPILGIGFALAALVFHTKASGHAPDDWDVARRYSRLGILLAAVGLVLNISAIAWVAVLWLQEQI